MIRGFFREEIGFSRPFIIAKLFFPNLNIEETAEFLVDTGADVTMLSEKDALRIGLNYKKLEKAKKDSGGIGGKAETYIIEVIIKIEPDFIRRTKILTIRNKLPKDISKEETKKLHQRIPSLLGRDIIGEFGLFMHERTKRILLLKDVETPGEIFRNDYNV